MRRVSNRVVAAVIALVFLASAGFAQDAFRYKELPNFHRVNERLYRGGQPRRGGMDRLAQLGIKTVIDLRGDGKRADDEAAEARAAGLRYFNIPLSNFGRPADAQVKQILSIINTLENQPVFIHCRRGSDRTGMIIAVFRISSDGWTSERALEEARRHGMGWWAFAMKDYVNDYYRDQAINEPYRDQTRHHEQRTGAVP
jgi:uncharacterized protein (TIGR01244 family)